MAYRITADEVRARLRTMVAAEISDKTLNSTAYIPLSEAWLDQVLSDNSLAYSTMTTTKQTLAKAAQIARCAWVVLAAAPKEAYKAGLTDFKGLNPESVKNAMDSLRKEWKEMLGLCSATTINVGGASTGGDDYQPDGEDLTQVHGSDETGDRAYSRFA